MRSSAVARNVHCLGLLRAGAVGDDTLYADEQARRAFMEERCRAAAAGMFGAAARRGPGRRTPGQVGFEATPEPDLRRWSLTGLEELFEQLWNLSLEPGHAGNMASALLLAGIPDSAPRRQRITVLRCVAVLQGMRERREAAAAADAADPDDEADRQPGEQRPLRLFAAPSPSPPGAPRLQASVARLRVSRVGHFSCPVRCLAVLLGAAPRGDGNPRSAASRAALAARVDDAPMLRALDDVTSLEELHEACAAGALPRIIHVGECPAGTWAEFEPRGRAVTSSHAPPGALWPVAWVAFKQRADAAAEDAAAVAVLSAAAGSDAAAPELPDEDRFDVLDIPLRARHGGDLACVKLITSENLLEEYGDESPEPTIDIEAVELFGFAAPHEA